MLSTDVVEAGPVAEQPILVAPQQTDVLLHIHVHIARVNVNVAHRLKVASDIQVKGSLHKRTV